MDIRRTGLGVLTAAALASAGAAFVQSSAWAQEGSSPRPSQPQRAAARMPDLVAVKLYADWCAKCRAMMPAETDMQRQIASGAKPVLFVTLDQTDADSQQAEYLLAALGFGDLWKEHAGKTGYFLLLDPKGKRVVGRLTSDMDAAAMTQAVDKALKTPSERPRSEHPEHPR